MFEERIDGPGVKMPPSSEQAERQAFLDALVDLASRPAPTMSWREVIEKTKYLGDVSYEVRDDFLFVTFVTSPGLSYEVDQEGRIVWENDGDVETVFAYGDEGYLTAVIQTNPNGLGEEIEFVHQDDGSGGQRLQRVEIKPFIVESNSDGSRGRHFIGDQEVVVVP